MVTLLLQPLFLSQQNTQTCSHKKTLLMHTIVVKCSWEYTDLPREFTTIAKFGGQTECIMGNWKIENGFYESY